MWDCAREKNDIYNEEQRANESTLKTEETQIGHQPN